VVVVVTVLVVVVWDTDEGIEEVIGGSARRHVRSGTTHRGDAGVHAIAGGAEEKKGGRGQRRDPLTSKK
jgi:hypothetical protein